MEEQAHPFQNEITKLGEVQQAILQAIQADQGLFNMGRQVMDNLNVTYLLVANLGTYILQKEAMVDEEIAKGNVTTFPGGGNGQKA